MATGYALVGIEGLKKNWGWALALGIALIILGMIALGAAVATTVASVLLFGWLLIIGGALEVAHGFVRRAWSGFFLDVLTGVLYLVVGFMFIRNPVEAAATLTLMLALALTSSARAVRWLGRRWVQLHRAIYAIVVLGTLHFWMSVKADIREPLVYALIFAALLGYRVWHSLRSRLLLRESKASPRASSPHSA